MDDVAVARLQGTYHKLIQQIRKTRLLILDDFGLHPFDQHIRKALMDIIEDRYGQASIIIAAQIPASTLPLNMLLPKMLKICILR